MRPIRMQPGTVAISIHALREEGDKPPGRPSLPTPYFYPRPPRGGRPINFNTDVLADPISIHALREEGDLRLLGRSLHSFYFYPRPPRGGRPWILLTTSRASRFLSTPSARRATSCARRWRIISKFLSTPSARRATLSVRQKQQPQVISIHALREEGDRTLSPG